MVDNNDSLFREVDEELRREQFAKLWDRYGTYIIGAAAAVILLVGGVKYWQAHKLATAEAAGAAYEAALDLANKGKPDESAKALAEIASTGPAGYAALAELSLAGKELKDGKRAEAFAKFEKIAADPRVDKLLAGFASLQAAAIRLGEADFTEMQNRLKPLASDTSAWKFLAKEYLGAAAVKAGKLDEARAMLSPLLADPLLPQSGAERIRRLMDRIAQAELASGKLPPSPPAQPAEALKPAP